MAIPSGEDVQWACLVDPNTGLGYNSGPASTIATGQVTVATTATLIVAARTGRQAVTIVQEGTVVVRIGISSVTTGTGVLLAGTVGSAITISGGAAIYGIVGTGTQLVSYIEEF